MALEGARVAFLTYAPLLEQAGGLFSPVASVRREIIIPTRALTQRGLSVQVVSLAEWPAEHVRAIVEKADRVVYGRMLKVMDGPKASAAYELNTSAYRAILSGAPLASRDVFCFSDDHFDSPLFAGFYRDVAPTSRAWVTSSDVLKQRLERETRCPVYVYPEVAELPKGSPRVPRRGLRERIAIWAAKRIRTGLEPWRLRLLWFGHPSNAQSLLGLMPELEALAQTTPLRLECVTAREPRIEALAARHAGASQGLQIVFMPWSLEYMPHALQDCDAVILPQELDDPKKLAKSNNRLIDAIHAGRFVVAHPLPSYEALKDFAWVGSPIADGLRWMLAHPGEALRRLVAGQEHVARHHSLDALADFWVRCLRL